MFKESSKGFTPFRNKETSNIKGSSGRRFLTGFTLIELLVVIAVIAILAVLIIIRLTSSLSDARDSRRLHDFDQIIQALEMYKLKHGGYFNDDGDKYGWDTSCNSASEFLVPNPSSLPNDPFIPDFLPEAPIDPINTLDNWGDDGYCYRYSRRWEGTFNCSTDLGIGYVLGIENLETNDRPHPQSPGFGCNIDYSVPEGKMSKTCLNADPETGTKIYGTDCRNFQTEFDWVTGR